MLKWKSLIIHLSSKSFIGKKTLLIILVNIFKWKNVQLFSSAENIAATIMIVNSSNNLSKNDKYSLKVFSQKGLLPGFGFVSFLINLLKLIKNCNQLFLIDLKLGLRGFWQVFLSVFRHLMDY